ncbi:phospholipase D-like domain-containing protein [Propionivibrio dicarboxylicus]|uniref:Cardiolipin synthase n=1 Tax=Propionivibrio dicarboxylicus TaxID=83767 RepID=A0A1G8M1E2_9RHOO|nr:phospholipase D-like domain-containing protein [Propionivibrio dicarboxylicus]SDI61771.1 cardiolipin synthase [Propionivibrio dicarboxylicus]
MILDLIARHWEILDALLAAIGLVVYAVASHSLHQRRHPSAAIAWVMTILLVPYIALPLYLAFGSRKIVPVRPAAGPRAVLPANTSMHATAARAQQLARAMGLPAPVAYEHLVIHADGSESLQALRRLIDGATRTLEVSTFLVGRDSLGNEIAARLQQRARDGVRVRLLIDGIGIYMGGFPDIAAFREAGVEVQRFVSPFRSPQRGRTNLRNHRKMLIADGRCLWCGGRNLAAEYFEGDATALIPRKPWVDLSFDLCGGVAAYAQRQFEEDWAFASEGTVPDGEPDIPPGSPVSGLAQLVASGPDRVDDTIHTLLVSACFTSQRRILAVTPYFVPDPVLLSAMTLAARRGVEVDLVLPDRSNHRLADFARHRALRELAAAGARIWLHPEMLHAKAVIVDDELAMAGSANLDGRSLFINYELMVAFYDAKAVRAFARWGELRRHESAPYVVASPGVLRELAEGLLLWLAFQL